MYNSIRKIVFLGAALGALSAPSAFAQFSQIGYLGNLRDLATNPAPPDQYWPYEATNDYNDQLAADGDQLGDDYNNAGDELSYYGNYNPNLEITIWNLIAGGQSDPDDHQVHSPGYDYPYPSTTQLGNPSHQDDVRRYIQNLHSKGLRVYAGVGAFQWGFDNLIANSPDQSVQCVSNFFQTNLVANADSQTSRDYMNAILDFLWSLGIDGYAIQTADEGICPATAGGTTTVGYSAYVTNLLVDHIKGAWDVSNGDPYNPRYENSAVIGEETSFFSIGDSGDHDSVISLTSRLNYITDFNLSAISADYGYGQGLIRDIQSNGTRYLATPPTSGGTAIHRDRLDWFLPNYQHVTSYIRDFKYNLGGDGFENYFGIDANPGDEVLTRVELAYEQDVTQDPDQVIKNVLQNVFSTSNGDELNALRDIYKGAEDAFYNNLYYDRVQEDAEYPYGDPYRAVLGPEDFTRRTDPRRPYLVDGKHGAYDGQLNTSQYKIDLLAVQANAQALLDGGFSGDRNKLASIVQAINEVANDIGN